MRSLLRATAVLAVSVMILGSSPSATADADQIRPFRGSLVGTDTMGAPCSGPASWNYMSTGTGNVAHAGVVTYTVSHCSHMTGPTSGEFGSGGVVYTTTSGDKLYTDHWGTFTLVMGPDGPEASIVDLHWQITGGTGRFLHAHGHGTGEGYSDLAAGTTKVLLDGVVTYDPSQRR